MNEQWFGWHFMEGSRLLRYGDGRKPRKGRILRVSDNKPLEMCVYGLHASPTVYDALHYAPGSTLCRVELIGPRMDQDDKSVAYARRLITWADASSMLRLWACWCVRQVWHLLTDERSREAVRVAERYARNEASNEELTAARAAARAAAGDAARAAAWDAVWAAAGVAARDAVWAAARAAARAAAGDAVWAAAGVAARAAARDAQKKNLEPRAKRLLGVTAARAAGESEK